MTLGATPDPPPSLTKGVPTRMLMYPEDSHPLDKPATEANHWLNIAAWIQAHM